MSPSSELDRVTNLLLVARTASCAMVSFLSSAEVDMMHLPHRKGAGIIVDECSET